MSRPSKVRLEKKKEREKENQKKLVKKRDTLAKKAKKEKEEWKLERQFREKKKPYVRPILGPNTTEQKLLQIEANLQKLKDMEEEYQKTVQEREGLNEALEAEGFKSLQDKLDFLNKNAQEMAEKQAEEAQKENLEKEEKLKKKTRKKSTETTK